jgi:hypothetical protein
LPAISIITLSRRLWRTPLPILGLCAIAILAVAVLLRAGAILLLCPISILLIVFPVALLLLFRVLRTITIPIRFSPVRLLPLFFFFIFIFILFLVRLILLWRFALRSRFVFLLFLALQRVRRGTHRSA